VSFGVLHSGPTVALSVETGPRRTTPRTTKQRSTSKTTGVDHDPLVIGASWTGVGFSTPAFVVSMTDTGAPATAVVHDTVSAVSVNSTLRSVGAAGAGPNDTAANVDGTPALRRSDTPTAA